MPGKILGLDISSDFVTAVQLTSGLKSYRVAACGRVMIAEDGGLERALQALLQQMDLKSDTTIAAIPGEDISYRNLNMPFREPKKIRQTLPFEMEAMVPFPIEDLVVDFNMINRASHSELLAVSVEKGVISEYLRQLQTFGIDPDVLEIRGLPLVSWLLNQVGAPDHGFLLEIGLRRVSLILFLQRQIVLVRTFPFDGDAIAPLISGDRDSDPLREDRVESAFRSISKRVRHTVHAFQWQTNRVIPPERIFLTGPGALCPEAENLLYRFLDTPVERINISEDQRIGMDDDITRVWSPPLMENALALALRDDKKGRGFNLRKDEFEVKKHHQGFKKEIRAVAIFVTLILIFLAVDFGVDYYFLQKKFMMMDQRITEVFKETFPDVKRIVRPVEQMKGKMNEIKRSAVSTPGIGNSAPILRLLQDTSQRIPKTMDVHVTRMVIDPETMRISGDTDTYDTVDSLQTRLEPSVYFSAVKINSANLDRTGKRVQFEIKLQRAN